MAYGTNDRGPTLNAVTWGMTAVATVFVILRLLSRTVLSKFSAGLDDAFTILALAVVLAACIIISVAVSAGLGKHIDSIPLLSQPKAIKHVVITNCIGVWTYALPKLAIVALLRRIFNYGALIITFLYALCAICVILTFATSVLTFTQCHPVASQWNPIQHPGHCIPFKRYVDLAYTASAFSAFLDLLLALFPQYTIFMLNMRLEKKISVGLAIGLSGIGCVVGIYKTTLIDKIGAKIDPTFELTPIQLWGVVETDILIISAALPTLGPLVRMVRDSTSRAYRSTGSSTERSRVGWWESKRSVSSRTADEAKRPINFHGRSISQPRDFRHLNSEDDIPLVERAWLGKADGSEAWRDGSISRAEPEAAVDGGASRGEQYPSRRKSSTSRTDPDLQTPVDDVRGRPGERTMFEYPSVYVP